uniref:Cnidarian restricted protein n=1 Tax=Clytia hemisphaerica TaxID=252671 RepID=A0A7M5VEI8_9CNID
MALKVIHTKAMNIVLLCTLHLLGSAYGNLIIDRKGGKSSDEIELLYNDKNQSDVLDGGAFVNGRTCRAGTNRTNIGRVDQSSEISCYSEDELIYTGKAKS